MENLTLKQFNNLKNEFVEFQINEMTTEDMVSYVRDILWTNVEKLTDVELEDENLFIFDRDRTPNEITLNVEWID